MGDEQRVRGHGEADPAGMARPLLDDSWAGGPPRWLDDSETHPGVFRAHPFLITWLLLAAGMVVILLLALQGTDLPSETCTVLVVVTVALAGLCAWVITRELQASARTGRGRTRRP